MKEKAKETKKPNIVVKPHQMYRGNPSLDFSTINL